MLFSEYAIPQNNNSLNVLPAVKIVHYFDGSKSGSFGAARGIPEICGQGRSHKVVPLEWLGGSLRSVGRVGAMVSISF